MKKIILVLAIVLFIFTLNSKKDALIIPKEAIRFRVIANSDTKNDQNTKILIRNALNTQVKKDLSGQNSIEKTRNIIKNNLGNYTDLITSTMEENNIKSAFNINYGMNYFPEKIYKGVKYEEGYYESLVVTLGDGMGSNWWCVLFPPLCLLEAEETEETTEVEYKFFIKEILDKYLK